MSVSTAQAQLQFIDFLRFEKRYSKHTITSYQCDLTQFFDYLSTQKVNRLQQIDEMHVRSFLAQNHRQGKSSRSLQRWLSSLRSCFKFALAKRWLTSDPTTGITAPKASKPLPKTLDVDQAQRLVEIAGNSWIEVRDRAIVELFYSSGLRLSELVGLDLDSINFSDSEMRVVGKAAKSRLIPVGRMALQQVKHYLEVRNQKSNEGETALFVSSRGGRLTARAIQYRIQHIAIKQGVSTQVHPHMLRHSCASHLLESSSDLRAVQDMLGHANLSTTQIYTHLDFQYLAKVHDLNHPRKNMQADKCPKCPK